MLEGGCRCGETRYSIALDALPPAYACHCHQCQRWTGSAFAVQIFAPEDALTVTGPIAIYEKVTGDHTSIQRVCGVCHSRIYNSNTRRPGIAVVRAGTLDRSEELECVAHIFTASKQGWVVIPDDVAQWPDMPPPEDIARLLGRDPR